MLRASAISARILQLGFHYATLLGIVCFGIKGNRTEGSGLVAQPRFWYKWFCLLSRLLICALYGYISVEHIGHLDNPHVIILSWIRLVCSLICACVILVMQFWYGQRVLRVVNGYLRVFRKVNALPGSQEEGGFGGRRELSLLVFKVFCLANELLCEVTELFSTMNLRFVVTVLCELYVTANATMIGHLCFVGYLSVGALYARVNHYVRHNLRRQLRSLEQPNGCRASRRELRAAGCRLDECLTIYDEIQRVGCDFHRLMELPLCLILLFAFLSMTLVSYFIMLQKFRDASLWLLVARLFFDVVLLTLAIHGAGCSSRVVRRLSLESSYVSEHHDWHMKLEMFLSRLNYTEFRVRPLGLFEISNELILVFLSGLVTYLTYIIQYGMQSNQI